MKLLPSILAIIFILRVMAADSAGQSKHYTIPVPSGATNSFVIDLQDGFHGEETVITVDGREVYKGTPTTNPVLGFAAGVSGTANSDHPVVAFRIPTRGVKWSEKVDLHAGAWLGISVTTNAHVKILQRAKAFGYD